MDYATREALAQLTPARVLQVLLDGNERFSSGQRLDRDLTRQSLTDQSNEQPMAVIFSGFNPRTPAELIFDLGLGDVYNIRIAGNFPSPAVLTSMEYACVIGGAKLILVMGHRGSGVIQCAIEQHGESSVGLQQHQCEHLTSLVAEIQEAVSQSPLKDSGEAFTDNEIANRVYRAVRSHVAHAVREIVKNSQTLRKLVDEQKLAIVGAIYDGESGKMEMITEAAIGLSLEARSAGGDKT